MATPSEIAKADGLPGQSIGGYRVERKLARGGAGVVYEAVDPRLGRKVALKLLLRGARASAEQAARFRREAQAAARLRHPNVVTVHEVGEHQGQPFIVMDLLEGASLADRVEREGPLDPREAAGLAEALARALAHAHGEGILHRDVKPANVLLGDDGVPRLADFGLAKELAAESITKTGQTLGTPNYMPPEQARGEALDGRADVYSLGACLYELLCGRPPFQGDHPLNVLTAVLRDEPARPSHHRAELPPELEAICLRCLEKEAGERYPSAAELAEDLGRFLQDEATEARPAGIRARTLKGARRHRRPLSVALGALLLLLLGGTGYERLVIAPRRAAQEAWEEHRAWERWQLVPLDLGVPARLDVTLPRAELARRLAGLEAIDATLGPSPPRERSRALLAAHLRLLAFRGGEETSVPEANALRAACQLVVDALVLRRRGEAEAAADRLAQALAQQPRYRPARMLELALLAERAPATFLEEARLLGPRADPELHTFLGELAQGALHRHMRACVRDAPTAAPRETRAGLGLAGDAAAALGLPREAQGDARRIALEETALAWERALDAAIAAGDELSLLERLAAACQGPPPVAPGPRLRAVLDAALGQLVARGAASDDGPTREGWSRSLLRAVRCEELLFYAVEQRRHPDPAYRRALLEGCTMSRHAQVHRLVLAALRNGLALAAVDLVGGAQLRGLERFLTDHPQSRAARFACFLSGKARERTTEIVQLEAALAGTVADLAPIYQGELRHLLADRLRTCLRRAPDAPRSQRREWARRLVTAASTARRELEEGDDELRRFDRVYRRSNQLYWCVEYEAIGRRELGQRDALDEVWREGISRFRARVERMASEDQDPGEERFQLARCLFGAARARSTRLGGRDDALAAARAARTELERCQESPRIALSRIRRLLAEISAWLRAREAE